MYLSGLSITNFRCFGAGKDSFDLSLRPGLTAIVGENDAGKTAVIDALRFALGTTDQEWYRLEDEDFHRVGENISPQITIQCKFSLQPNETGTFIEYLTYSKDGNEAPLLYVNWTAKDTGERRRGKLNRRVEVCSGKNGDGPSFAPEVRELLWATYLKPLRDADQALSAGRGSRLSQILSSTKQVSASGVEYIKDGVVEPGKLSVRGIGDYANDLLEDHDGVKLARGAVNQHLKSFTLKGDDVESRIRVGASSNADARLKQLLEKLDLSLRVNGRSGLGTNNTLFMACELILLAQESEVSKLLLIEEPEAHLHPQKQLRVMKALQDLAVNNGIQIIVTTHSPNLASVIELDNLVLLWKSRAYSLARESTMLSNSDYGFLQRFLDVTKANLFFARGVMIVEGDAENILLPTLATILGRDFTENGVSIVNVGGVGLSRYASIFKRKEFDAKAQKTLDVPVACVTDMDVMPNCAPEIVGRSKKGEALPVTSDRRWRVKKDYESEGMLVSQRSAKENKASGQSVRTFVSDEWTLEYDLALGPKGTEGGFSCGLAEDVFVAACLAENDDAINLAKTTIGAVEASATEAFAALKTAALPTDGCATEEVLASHVYAKFVKKQVSKAISAQYLSQRLISKYEHKVITAASLRQLLPKYITEAIDYVTGGGVAVASAEEGGQNGK
jgi:putative ATP-dependent endonuclease of OLD family